MSLRIKLVLCLLLSSNFNLYSAKIVIGNSNIDTTTTSFNIGTHAFDIFGSSFTTPTMYIGAGSTIANNDYAVAYVNNNTNTLTAIAPANIMLNSVSNQTNPLFGAQINFLKLNNALPVVMINGSQNVYKYTSITPSQLALVSAGPITDTTGATSDQALALEAANGTNSYTFVACTPHGGGGNFGGAGSGIDLFAYASPNFVLQNNNLAIPLDNSSSFIKIGSGANTDVVLANTVDLHWSGELNCLFVALQAQAGSAGGARSIAVGKIQAVPDTNYQTINFEPFVPDSAITGNNQIIGTATSGNTVTAIKLKTMRTSTCLNYLIILGGNGTASTVGNQVYALPVVSANNSNRGNLASKNQTPTDIFASSKNLFVGRTLNTAAATSSDLLTNGDTAAVVGHGILPLAASEIVTDLFTSGDSVYATIGTSSGQSGIFQSQAIFDSNGLIANWTSWQPVSGFDGEVFGAAIDATNGTYWYLTGADASSVNTIKKTLWSDGNQDGLFGGTTTNASLGLVSNLSTLFPTTNGGLFNLINVPKQDPALNASGNDLSLLIATGNSQLALIEPSAAIDGDFGSELIQSSNDFFPSANAFTTIANIAGPNLTNIGAIVTANIATNTGTNMSWVLCGGTNGAAILRATNGNGFNSPITNLGQIPNTIKFEPLGNYQFVNKITSDASYIYILTNKKLDRIALNSSNLSNVNPTNTLTIAQVGSLPGTSPNDCFNDIIVTGDLAILATSAGLFRVGNGSSIQNTTVNWTSVTVPEQLALPCTQLIAISPTAGLASSLALGGNLYTISSYRGLNQTIINRFYVNNSGTIDNNTILPLPDLYVQGSLSYFINFESFRSSFFTDGTLLINDLSQDAKQNSYVRVMQPGISSGQRITEVKKYYDINLTPITQANFIAGVTRSSNAGNLLVSGEFGMLVNE